MAPEMFELAVNRGKLKGSDSDGVVTATATASAPAIMDGTDSSGAEPLSASPTRLLAADIYRLFIFPVRSEPCPATADNSILCVSIQLWSAVDRAVWVCGALEGPHNGANHAGLSVSHLFSLVQATTQQQQHQRGAEDSSRSGKRLTLHYFINAQAHLQGEQRAAPDDLEPKPMQRIISTYVRRAPSTALLFSSTCCCCLLLLRYLQACCCFRALTSTLMWLLLVYRSVLAKQQRQPAHDSGCVRSTGCITNQCGIVCLRQNRPPLAFFKWGCGEEWILPRSIQIV